MKLSTRIINQLYNAHLSLDGLERPVEKDGKVVGVVKEVYDFTTKLRYNIGKNITLLRRVSEPYMEARKALIAAHSPDGTGEAIDKNPILRAEFLVEQDKLLANEEDIPGLLKLDINALLTGPKRGNDIPSSVLSDLDILVEGELK